MKRSDGHAFALVVARCVLAACGRGAAAGARQRDHCAPACAASCALDLAAAPAGLSVTRVMRPVTGHPADAHALRPALAPAALPARYTLVHCGRPRPLDLSRQTAPWAATRRRMDRQPPGRRAAAPRLLPLPGVASAGSARTTGRSAPPRADQPPPARSPSCGPTCSIVPSTSPPIPSHPPSADVLRGGDPQPRRHRRRPFEVGSVRRRHRGRPRHGRGSAPAPDAEVTLRRARCALPAAPPPSPSIRPRRSIDYDPANNSLAVDCPAVRAERRERRPLDLVKQ